MFVKIVKKSVHLSWPDLLKHVAKYHTTDQLEHKMENFEKEEKVESMEN